MKDRLSALFIVFALVLIVRLYPYGELSEVQGAKAFSLGFVVLTGYLLGEILAPIRLPRITGYLLAGMLIGPYALKIVSKESVKDFLLIDQIALTLIALTAGGELRLANLKRCWKGIISITLNQTVWVFLWGTFTTYILVSYAPIFAPLSTQAKWGISLVIGVIAIAQSPSTTIAIITETRASGLSSDLALGVAVVKDVIVITLFTCVLMALGMMDQGLEALEWEKLLRLGEELLLSIGVGVLAGIALSFYLAKVKVDPILFLLAFCYLVSAGSQSFHLDALLVCVTAGVWVTNASSQGRELIKTIEESSLIIYVIFFCVAGASLNLNALADMWILALLLVVLRMASLAFSTWIGAYLSGISLKSLKTYWMVFLPQAGVSLGLAALLNREGLSWAPAVKTLVVACIAVNQIIGPILMKYALIKSGDAPLEKASTR
ncbi:MAG: cation:proton antiporter [Candidatus Omnitrophica bacterium]|nr:cation:proton antiporter [Candidatus Omnitrophota bacterium]